MLPLGGGGGIWPLPCLLGVSYETLHRYMYMDVCQHFQWAISNTKKHSVSETQQSWPQSLSPVPSPLFAPLLLPLDLPACMNNLLNGVSNVGGPYSISHSFCHT